jgi:hypothetical protein
VTDCTGALAVGNTDCEWSVVWFWLFLLGVVVLRIAVSVVYRTSAIDRLNKTIDLKNCAFRWAVLHSVVTVCGANSMKCWNCVNISFTVRAAV